MISPEELAQELTLGMKRNHMSRAALMRAAQRYYPVTYDNIREIERGRSRNPSWYVVLALSKVLGFEHKIGFAEPGGEGMYFPPPKAGGREKKTHSASPAAVDISSTQLIARTTRLLMEELAERRQKVSGEQVELWAVDVAGMFAKTGMKNLDINFIRSYLNDQR